MIVRFYWVGLFQILETPWKICIILMVMHNTIFYILFAYEMCYGIISFTASRNDIISNILSQRNINSVHYFLQSIQWKTFILSVGYTVYKCLQVIPPSWKIKLSQGKLESWWTMVANFIYKEGRKETITRFKTL